MKRQRGRGRKPGGGGGGGGGNHGNRPLESNGPEVKIRGTAAQIYEKYMQYARDSQSGGDRVKYENYLQHAEHYFRIMAATMPREQRIPQQLTGGEGFINAGETPTGEDAAPINDAMKVVDEGDDEEAEGDEIEAGADGEGDEGEQSEGQPQQASNQGGEQRDGGRRRRRRRHRDGDRGGPNPGGGGNNGSDPEARSALDALAHKQGALG